MLDPNDADLVNATVNWARKHGQENRRVLSVTHLEWMRIWLAAWLRSLVRSVRELLSGAGA